MNRNSSVMICKLIFTLLLLWIYPTYTAAAERNLLFMVCKDPKDFIYDIYSADRDLNYKQIIAHGMMPTWSPDGTKIAFVRNRKVPDNPYAFAHDLCLATPDGSQIKNIKSQTPIREVWDFTWSPDGQKIAWATGDHLFISTLSEEVLAYKAKKQIMSVEWRLDGKRLVFLDATQGIHLFDLETKEAKIISPKGLFPRILPVHDRLIYLQRKETTEMWAMDIETGTSELLARDIWITFPKKNLINVSKNGQKIIFYSGNPKDKRDKCDLGVYDMKTKKVNYRKEFQGILEAVSYDGAKIAGIFTSGGKLEYGIFDLNEGTKSVIYQVEAHEFAPTPMTIYLRHMDW